VNEGPIKIWLAIIGIASVGVIGMTLAPTLRAQSPITLASHPDYFTKAKRAMSEEMRDPDSVKYGDLFEGMGLSGRKTVCGTVNAKNGFGCYTGMNPFLSILSM